MVASGSTGSSRTRSAHTGRPVQAPVPPISGFFYEAIVTFFSFVFYVFFREIQVRGAYKVPPDGPVIFVAAPHANQFVDPTLIAIKTFFLAHRRLSFLIAEKSYKRKFIGFLSKQMQSIPVGRTQDTLRPGLGKVHQSAADPLVLLGVDTRFTKECTLDHVIRIPGSSELVGIKEIRNDTELVLEGPFSSSRAVAILARGETPYEVASKVDNSGMFARVFQHLADGHCIGIFPEGGSHDRTEMLPLKAGVAIMALGTLASAPDCNLKIIPIGLHYFHPEKFRSRAVIEYGNPMSIQEELIAMYKNGTPEEKKTAVATLLSEIADALGTVTVNCPDYETLALVQTCQRLYRPSRHIPLPLVVEFTRRFVQGYQAFKDDERIIFLKRRILEYERRLYVMGLRDHQVETAHRSKFQVAMRLIRRTLRAIVCAILCIPGFILGSPILIATKLISRRKAAAALRASTVKIAARDVIATWKVLVGLWLVPSLFSFYVLCASYLCFFKYKIWAFSLTRFLLFFSADFLAIAVFIYATLIIGETGMDLVRSLRPLYLALSPYHSDTLEKLRALRRDLVMRVTDIVNELGPRVFPDLTDRLKESQELHYCKPGSDPRTDLRGLRSMTPEGTYDLAELPIFSSVGSGQHSRSSSTTLPVSRSRSRSHSCEREKEEAQATGAELNQEIARRLRDAMRDRGD